MNQVLKALRQATLAAIMPPPNQTVSEWADNNRILVSSSSAEPGRWRTSRAPYQREVMDAFTQVGVYKLALMFGAQTGKTEIELNAMGKAIAQDPGAMLFVQPTDSFASDFSKRRVTPMIDACPKLKELVYEAKSRDSSNTINMKSFPGGSITFAGANSPTELAGRPIRYVFMDEVDRYPGSVGNEGDPVNLVEQRTATFFNRRIILTSTPLIKGASRIEREYKKGTQEEWCIACPACGEYHPISFDDIRFEKETYDQDGEKAYRVLSVKWRCPGCNNENSERDTKRAKGKWIAKRPDAIQNGIRSFHMNAFASPWSSWKELVQEFLDAGDDPNMLQTFYNTKLGEPFEIRDRSGKPEKLMARREYYAAEVPKGVLVLTMGIDTQGNRLEYEVVGWGRGDESWGISRGVIPGRADAPGVWEEVDALLDREWQHQGGRKMRIGATFIDSGGNHTQDVYDACARRANKRIWPIKGEEKPGIPYIRQSKKDGLPMPLFLIGVDAGKEAIIWETGVDTPGPRYMHFPIAYERGYDEEYFRGLISEKLEIQRRGGKNVAVWVKIYNRNEPLDCRNYARAAFKRFDWDLDKYDRVLNGKKEIVPARVAERAKQRQLVLSRGIQID